MKTSLCKFMAKAIPILLLLIAVNVGCVKTELHTQNNNYTIKLTVTATKTAGTDNRAMFGDAESKLYRLRVINFSEDNKGGHLLAGNQLVPLEGVTTTTVTVSNDKTLAQVVYVIANETPEMTEKLENIGTIAQLKAFDYTMANYFPTSEGFAHKADGTTVTDNAPFGSKGLPMSEFVNVPMNQEAITMQLDRNVARVDVYMKQNIVGGNILVQKGKSAASFTTTTSGKLYDRTHSAATLVTKTIPTIPEDITLSNADYKLLYSFYTPARKYVGENNELVINVNNVKYATAEYNLEPIVINSDANGVAIDEIKAGHVYEVKARVTETQISVEVTIVTPEDVIVNRPTTNVISEPANTFMVKSGRDMLFNPKRIGVANQIDPATTNNLNPIATKVGDYWELNADIDKVELAWQTSHGRTDDAGGSLNKMIIKELRYDKAENRVLVFANPGAGGSAYINAKDAEGKIIWSWHIWVTNDEITTFDTQTKQYGGDANNYQMQDRALGAITKTAGVGSYGMLYQWGRKDPFTPGLSDTQGTELYDINAKPLNTLSDKGIGGVFTAKGESAANIATLTQNPSVYYGTSANMPIVSADPIDLTNDWWNSAAKTIYDPCPYGYRIPANGVYGKSAEWLPQESGRMWNSSFFPASGYRRASSGKFYVVGSSGYGWMSTPGSATGGYNLRFHSGYVNPNNNFSRSHGFPVRCIID